MNMILAVDDEEDVLYTLQAICEVAGLDIKTVNNPRQALSCIARGSYDLVLLDYHMPDMNGLKLTAEIRKLYKELPILVLTVDESLELADRFLGAGASDFAVKPIKAADLISRVRLHLQLNKARGNKNIELQNNELYLPKGLTESTLELVIAYLRKSTGPVTLNAVARNTGLSYQTAHRYLNYLLQQGYIEVNTKYGKVGRPTNEYYLKEK